MSCFSQQNFQNQLAERLTAYSEIKIKSRKATGLISNDRYDTHAHTNLTGEICWCLFSCFLHSLHSHIRSPIQFNQFKCTFPVSKFPNKSSYSFTTSTWLKKKLAVFMEFAIVLSETSVTHSYGLQADFKRLKCNR